MEKDAKASQQDATLAAAVTADAEMLDSYRTSIYTLRDDLSLHATRDVAQMHYFDVTILRVKPGHQHDFDALSKMYMDAYGTTPDANWATYQDMYGDESGDRYILISLMKSLGELDQQMTTDKKVMAGMSADQMKKMGDLAASTIESAESHLFVINPKMSYASDRWIKADPSFWGQKQGAQ